jgi:hypothetical protein
MRLAPKPGRNPVRARLRKAKDFERFYAAYLNNSMTKLALADGDNSIQGKRLDKYLALAHEKPAEVKKMRELPTELDKLLSLQGSNGRWDDLTSVMSVLEIGDEDLQVEGLDVWEEATALALAYLRQRSELWDHLESAYLRGAVWVDPRLVARAVQLLLCNTQAPVVGEEARRLRILIECSRGRGSTPVLHESPDASIPYGQLSRVYPDNPMISPLPRSSPPIAERNCVVDALKLQIVTRLGDLDTRLEGLRRELKTAIVAYKTATAHGARAASFTEVVATLGNGAEPCIGLRDWRGRGVRSLRRIVAGLLVDIYELHQSEKTEDIGGVPVLRMQWDGKRVSDHILTW